MEQSDIITNNYSPSILQRIREKIYRLFRLTSRPVVKVYRGYGGAGKLMVFGHVLALSPLPRKKYRQNTLTNSLALLRLFMVRPVPRAKVYLRFNGDRIEQTTEKDGFFRIHWTPQEMPSPGRHKIEVFLSEGVVKKFYGQVKGESEILVPYPGQYAVISDIDDTFLISHSSNLRKRLFVLLTENAHSRKPFEGVVKHYQALALAGTTQDAPNPFFYVSSSEWNLYNYIMDFSRKNELPVGVYLLSQIKRFKEVWKTGQNKHHTKFMRIVRILETFPEQQFILLGDDSQQDPVIYSAVAEHFRDRIKVVYFRNVFDKNMRVVEQCISRIESIGIPVCHFKHSRDAIQHSSDIGLFEK